MVAQTINVPDQVEFIGFRDLGEGIVPNSLSYNVQNSLFYSKPKNRILQKAIELVIENCKNENYGFTPVCTSGPGVFGRALATYGIKKEHIIGVFMPLTPNHKNMNRSYILPDGTIFALHKNAWMPNIEASGISAFGFKSTNNYLKMWNDHEYYDESIIFN